MLEYFNLQDLEIIDLEKRFWARVKLPNHLNDKLCWEWIGCLNSSGYGTISFFGSEFVHRISYWLYVDFCQSDLLGKPKIKILHKCDNKICINPSHLFKGTQKDNIQDKIKKGRDHNLIKTHCSYGHE